MRLDGDNLLYFDASPYPGIFRATSVKPPGCRENSCSGDTPLISWTLKNKGLYYVEVLADVERIRRFDLQTGAPALVSGPTANVAREASLTVASAEPRLVYSRYSESTSFIRLVRTDTPPR